MPTVTVLTRRQQYEAVAARIRTLAPAGAIGYQAQFATGCYPTMEGHGRDFFSLGDYPTGVPEGKLELLFLDSRLRPIGRATTTVQFEPLDAGEDRVPQEAKKVAQHRQQSQHPDVAGAVERGVQHLASMFLALFGIKPSKKAKSRRKQRADKPRNQDSQTGPKPLTMPIESRSATPTPQVEPPRSRPLPVETLQPARTKTGAASARTFDESAVQTVAPYEPPPRQASQSEPPHRAVQASKPASPTSSAQTSKPEIRPEPHTTVQQRQPESAKRPEPHTTEQQRQPECAKRPEPQNKHGGEKAKQAAARRAMPNTIAWNRIKHAVASLTDGDIMLFVANPQIGLGFLEFLAALCPGGLLATD